MSIAQNLYNNPFLNLSNDFGSLVYRKGLVLNETALCLKMLYVAWYIAHFFCIMTLMFGKNKWKLHVKERAAGLKLIRYFRR